MDFETNKSLLNTAYLAKSVSHIKQANIATKTANTIESLNKFSSYFIPARNITIFSEYLEKIHKQPNHYLQNQELLRFSNIATQTLSPVSQILGERNMFMEKYISTFYKFEEEYLDKLEEQDIQSAQEEKVEDTPPLYFTEATRAKLIIEDVWKHNQQLYELKPRDFEVMTAELLRNQGYEVQLTKETRDGGYDIYALYSIRGQRPIKILVECKRYGPKRPVGIEIVRSFKTVISEQKANKGLIITSSYFSADAKATEAETPYLLEFKDRQDILDWVNDYKGVTIR